MATTQYPGSDALDRRYPVGYQMPAPPGGYAPGSPEALTMGTRPQPVYKPNAPVDMTAANAALRARQAANPPGGRPGAFDAPTAADFPRTTGAYQDLISQRDDAIRRGDMPGRVGSVLAGSAALIPAAAVDTYQGLKTAAQPLLSGGQNFLSALTSGFIPRANAAATTAAAKATTAAQSTAAAAAPVPFESGYSDTPTTPGGTKGTPESADSNARWNAFVQSQLGSLNAQPVAPGPMDPTGSGRMPTWTKQAGEAAIAAGGAPRNLDYGYGTAIVGSGRGSKGQFNTFTGVGQGPAPMGGAGYYGPSGGPGGARGGGSIDDIVDSHMRDVIAQHDQYSNDGTMTGMRKAHELRGYLARLEGLRQGEATRQYQQGIVGTQQGQLQLQREQTAPDTFIKALTATQIADKKWEEAERSKRSYGGEAPAAPPQTLTPGTYVYNPMTKTKEWVGWQGLASP
jgi:hypothetical protein